MKKVKSYLKNTYKVLKEDINLKREYLIYKNLTTKKFTLRI